MFLIFCLGRIDVFAPDDFGLRCALQKLYDLPDLPTRLQAAGSLRGGENQRPLGLVRRSPWSTTYPLETKDSLLWAQLSGVPQSVCQQFAAAAIQRL